MDQSVPWMSFNEFQQVNRLNEDFLHNFKPGKPNPPVLYDDSRHRYYSSANVTYTSATQLLDKFKHKFDVHERSEYMASRYSESPDYWQEKWAGVRDASLERGNAIHSDKEKYLYEQGVVFERPKYFKVLKSTDYRNRNYIHLPDGIFPELLLWNHRWRAAGRADKIIIDTHESKVQKDDRIHWMYTRTADVEDYKTNKSIYFESFKDKKGYRMMTGPLSHLMDCNGIHYTLQLSIYQYFLEEMGFIPGKRRIIHIKHEIEGLGTPPPKIYEVPYMRNEVIAMLTYNLKSRRA